MKEYLKHYRCVLHTIGPVFVGSGKEIHKKEYMFFPDRKIGVIDMEKMYVMIKKHHLESDYEKFMLNKNNGDLKNWMMDHKIPLKESKNCMKYIVEQGDTSLQKGNRTAIMEATKDAYGLPYIPGSSIKGMLRTILLSGSLIERPEQYRNEKQGMITASKSDRANRNTYQLREIKQLEQKKYCTLQRVGTKPNDAVNDVMSGFIVGDSKPLTHDDMVLCQKVERRVDGVEKRLNLLRECVRPETDIVFDLTIDEGICSITKDDIIHAIQLARDNYNDCFLSSFSGMDLLYEDNVFLGGGAGFVSKTVVYPLLGKDEGVRFTKDVFDKTRVPKNHKHSEDIRMNVSPHILKCTRVDGKLYQMGMCTLEIQ